VAHPHQTRAVQTSTTASAAGVPHKDAALTTSDQAAAPSPTDTHF
jgi:hypothetical protein